MVVSLTHFLIDVFVVYGKWALKKVFDEKYKGHKQHKWCLWNK